MAVKRRKRKSRAGKVTIYRVKKSASSAAYNFLSAFQIFLGILTVTVFFIFYQWKNVKFRSYLTAIDQYSRQILELHAENSRLETIKNELLKKVPQEAATDLKMITPVKKPLKLDIESKKLHYYETKDNLSQN